MIEFTVHNKKMEGMFSISTSATDNTFCQHNRTCSGAVCKSCYSYTLESMRPALRKKLKRNLDQLIKPLKEIVLVPYKVLRFNSFGEIQNIIHLKNMVKIALDNPETWFTLWTKRADIVKRCFSKMDKPNNFRIIYSSFKKNVEEPLPPFFDQVFTVYNKAYLVKNSISPNCQSHCLTCQRCYGDTKNITPDTVYIREQIKSGNNKLPVI